MNNKQIEHAIIAKIDSLKELKFGCRVVFNSRYQSLFLAKGKILTPHLTIEDYDGEEVIGGQLTAQELLKVLPHHWYMKRDGKNYEFVNIEHLGTSKFKNQYFIFEDKEFHKQEPKTVQFIWELINEG